MKGALDDFCPASCFSSCLSCASSGLSFSSLSLSCCFARASSCYNSHLAPPVSAYSKMTPHSNSSGEAKSCSIVIN